MESTPSLQPVAPPLLQGTQAYQSMVSQFLREQTKSYRMLEKGTTPDLTVNRVTTFNLSSFLSNSPENLTLDSIQKKF